MKSFRNKIYANETVLSKYIWELKDAGKEFDIKWTILKRTSGYNKIKSYCKLCLPEKYAICKFKLKKTTIEQKK